MQGFEWFTHMQGPVFLAAYATLGVAFFVFCLMIRIETDSSEVDGPIDMDVAPDPYQIAYLRGGKNEVLRTAALELYSSKLLEETKSKYGPPAWTLIPGCDTDPRLSLFARQLAPYFSVARKPVDIFKADLGPKVAEKFRSWDQWIDEAGYRVSERQQFKLRNFSLGLGIGFASVGLIKVVSALMRDIHNVAFALILMVVGTIAIILTSLPRRFNARGREYLRNTQIVNAQYRSGLKENSQLNSSAIQPVSMSGDYTMPLMAMGIFGIAALNGSPFDDFRKSYLRSEATGGGCGSSCAGATWMASCGASDGRHHDAGSGCGAGSDAGGGASCGGGGGSGCGGGGCGGGGCGGCGGS